MLRSSGTSFFDLKTSLHCKLVFVNTLVCKSRNSHLNRIYGPVSLTTQQAALNRYARAMDIASMWNHADPTGSETTFCAALEQATGDSALILQTQIARTYGIRQQFERGQSILNGLDLSNASPEATVHYWLEWGRTFCSATHAPESLTNQHRDQARTAFTNAFELAQAAKLDALAVDALHMMGFVDTSPEELLAWNQKTLAYIEASHDPEARRWEGSLRNNLGYALHQVGRLEEALEQFKLALAVREKQGETRGIRIARWMIAWTLRGLGRFDDALEIQLRLEREWDADGRPDPYVYEELTALYRATENIELAERYRAKLT
jgi:tetratricopeptide (TPR) repeat protein